MSTTQYPDVWRVETGDAEIPTTSLLDSQPAPKRGASADFAFQLRPDGYGDHVARYEQLVAFRDFGGEFDVHMVDGGRAAYSETHRGSAPGGSLVVALRPPDDVPTARGIWGLVESVEDSTEVPDRVCFVDLSVVYLAPLGEYDDRFALARDLEADAL